MKLKNIFKFSIDSILWRKRSSLAVFLMAAITVAILDLVATNYYLSMYRILHTRELIAEPMSIACYVEELYLSPDDMGFSEHLSLFMRDMKEVSGIKYSGRYYPTEVPIEVIRNSNPDLPMQSDKDSMMFLYADQELLPLCGVSYVLYGNVSVEKEATPILLGFALKDRISPGQIVMLDSEAYQVVGYLEKGNKWLPKNFRTSNEEEITMDEAVVAFIDGERISSFGDLNGYIYMSNIFLALEEEAKFQTVSDALTELASKYNIAVDLQDMNLVLEKMKQDNWKEIREYLIFLVFITLVSLLAIISISLVSILVYKKMYGAMYASGFSIKDFAGMFFLKNAILITVAACAAWAYRTHEIITETYEGLNIILRVHNQYVLGFLAVICAVAILATSVIPVVYLCHFSPAQMLQRGKE